jgi:hypothetical protein
MPLWMFAPLALIATVGLGPLVAVIFFGVGRSAPPRRGTPTPIAPRVDVSTALSWNDSPALNS